MSAKVVLVGAGIVGNFTSILLKKSGYDVTVYEKGVSPTEFKQQGKSINLAYSVRGQKAIESSGIKIEETVPMVGRLLHGQEKTNYLAYSQFGEALLSINRNEFNAKLFEHAEKTGVEYHFNHNVTSVNLKKKMLTVICDDGKVQNVEYDFLLGTDGSNTIVGNLLDKSNVHEKPVWQYIELEIDSTKEGKFKLEDAENFHIWPKSQHIFMIALPNKNGTFTLTLFVHNDSSIDLKAIQHRKDFDEFNNIITSIVKNKSELELIEVRRSFTQNKVSSIYQRISNTFLDEDNCVGLLGDALVAPPPFLGLACNAHIESAYIFVELIKKFSTTLPKREAFQSALVQFYTSHMPNMIALYEASVENAKVLSYSDPDYELKYQLTQYLEKNYLDLFVEPHSLYSFKHMNLAKARFCQLLQNKILSELVEFPDVRIGFSKIGNLSGLLVENTNFGVEIERKMKWYADELKNWQVTE